MSVLTWTGPIYGLGNRLLALAAAAAVGSMVDRPIAFGWRNDDECPCDADELFAASDRLTVVASEPLEDAELDTLEWDPLLILQRAREVTTRALPVRPFLEAFLENLRTLPIQADIHERARRWSQAPERGETNVAIHIRRTDRIAHHRNLFARGAPLNELLTFGVGKSLLYLVSSPERIRDVEDREILRLLRRTIRRMTTRSTYTLYCDSRSELERLESWLLRRAAGLDYYPSPATTTEAWDTGNLRETSARDALVELLAMSSASSIVQSNRTSTFSLVAALIGRTPIVSRRPAHRFWREIERTFHVPAPLAG